MKIADFGLATFESKQLTQRAGTANVILSAFFFFFREVLKVLQFCAPEVMRCEQYGRAADVWSVGVIFYNLLVKSLPFKLTSTLSFEPSVYSSHHYETLAFQCLDDSLRELISCLLQVDQRERISAAAALQHRWFSGDVSASETSARPRADSPVLNSPKRSFDSSLERRVRQRTDGDENTQQDPGMHTPSVSPLPVVPMPRFRLADEKLMNRECSQVLKLEMSPEKSQLRSFYAPDSPEASRPPMKSVCTIELE